MEKEVIMKKWLYVIACFIFIAGCASAPKMTAIKGMPAGAPVEHIQITGNNCEWSPAVINVKQGTHVFLEVKSVDWDYNFQLKEYGLHFPVKKGETVTAEFYASEKGEFQYGCYIEKGFHYEWGGMVGKLIVE